MVSLSHEISWQCACQRQPFYQYLTASTVLAMSLAHVYFTVMLFVYSIICWAILLLITQLLENTIQQHFVNLNFNMLMGSNWFIWTINSSTLAIHICSTTGKQQSVAASKSIPPARKKPKTTPGKLLPPTPLILNIIGKWDWIKTYCVKHQNLVNKNVKQFILNLLDFTTLFPLLLYIDSNLCCLILIKFKVPSIID